MQRKTDELLFKSAKIRLYCIKILEIDLIDSSEIIVNVWWQQGEQQCWWECL